jgi:hypothetical protein
MRGMKSMSLLVAVLVVSSSFAKPPQTPTPLKVEGGLLQGIVEDGLTIYRGIPYAAPPVCSGFRETFPHSAAIPGASRYSVSRLVQSL